MRCLSGCAGTTGPACTRPCISPAQPSTNNAGMSSNQRLLPEHRGDRSRRRKYGNQQNRFPHSRRTTATRSVNLLKPTRYGIRIPRARSGGATNDDWLCQLPSIIARSNRPLLRRTDHIINGLNTENFDHMDEETHFGNHAIRTWSLHLSNLSEKTEWWVVGVLDQATIVTAIPLPA